MLSAKWKEREITTQFLRGIYYFLEDAAGVL